MSVLTAGLATNLGGGVSITRLTLTYADCTTVGTTQTVALMTLPKGSMVLGVRIKGTTAFRATPDSVTALTVSVGSASNGASGYASAFDIYQAVAAGTFQMSSAFKQGPDADEAINAYLTATGANLSTMSAGAVNIDVVWLNITTP